MEITNNQHWDILEAPSRATILANGLSVRAGSCETVGNKLSLISPESRELSW
jgi:hypothetical protein